MFIFKAGGETTAVSTLILDTCPQAHSFTSGYSSCTDWVTLLRFEGAEDNDNHKLPEYTDALEGAEDDDDQPGPDDTAAAEGAEDDDNHEFLVVRAVLQGAYDDDNQPGLEVGVML